MMKPRIIYQDNAIVVAYKPAGLATQTAKVGQADMVSELKKLLKVRYLGVVHRLDQPVEGLLVFALTQEAAGKLTKQLAGGSLNKQYYAAVSGKLSHRQGTLVDYLIKTKDNMAQVVTGKESSYSDAKKAVLHYKILEETLMPIGAECRMGQAEAAVPGAEQIGLADITIETGRFHQIRCQMANAGMPLLGDLKYGKAKRSADSEKTPEGDQGSAAAAAMKPGPGPVIRNVALCAYKLVFQHPVTGKRMSYEISPENPAFEMFSGNNFGCNCLY